MNSSNEQLQAALEPLAVNLGQTLGRFGIRFSAEVDEFGCTDLDLQLGDPSLDPHSLLRNPLPKDPSAEHGTFSLSALLHLPALDGCNAPMLADVRVESGSAYCLPQPSGTFKVNCGRLVTAHSLARTSDGELYFRTASDERHWIYPNQQSGQPLQGRAHPERQQQETQPPIDVWDELNPFVDRLKSVAIQAFTTMTHQKRVTRAKVDEKYLLTYPA